MNKNLLIRILGVSTVAVNIISGIFSLMMGEYFAATGVFTLGVLIFVHMLSHNGIKRIKLDR